MRVIALWERAVERAVGTTRRARRGAGGPAALLWYASAQAVGQEVEK